MEDILYMEKLKCEELLKESEKEYKKIADAVNALLRGELSGEDVDKISNDALNRVDLLISEYEKN